MMPTTSVVIREDIRRQIVVLARRPSARSSAFTAERPTRWRPNSVVNPDTGHPFTRPGAWDFIATCAETGHEIEVLSLRKPAGATAYVMKIWLEANRRRLYVKVELRSGRILGRSFHESDY